MGQPREGKQTVKGMRLVAVNGEVYEVRDAEGLLATDRTKAVVIHRVDDDARTEIGRATPAAQGYDFTGGDPALLGEIMQRWFRK